MKKLRPDGRPSLGPDQIRVLLLMGAIVLLLHLLGFGILLGSLSSLHHGAITVGIGLTAYLLGMRHAFDADHIAAIDNTTRKLAGEERRSLSVGFFFSLGHSTVVLALALAFAIGLRGLTGPVENDGSTLHEAAGWIGTGVSSTFLFLIAILNLVALVGGLHLLAAARRGEHDEGALERQLDRRGLMNRIYRRFTKTVTRSWQMYPIGILFGVGFDTATEVALLFLAADAAGAGLPFYTILSLPLIFAAGMSLFDTIDGALMSYMYGWALATPVRKLVYNLTLTALSVLVALAIASIELSSLLAEKLGLGGVWKYAGEVDMNTIGLVVAGLFVLSWPLAIVASRLAATGQGADERVEETAESDLPTAA